MLKSPVLAAWLVYFLCHGFPVESHVICDESSMTVGVEKALYPGLRVDELRLSDSSNTACSLQNNSTHIFAVIPLNSCGTEIEETADNLIFVNEITMVDNALKLITRKCVLELKFNCRYPKRGNVTLGYKAHREDVEVLEKGFGRFTYQFEFYPNKKYQTPFVPDVYPLECDMSSRIYMQIEALTSITNAELFVESCSAAPYDNPNYRPTYSIISDGCKVDKTVEFHPNSHKRQFRFSMEAFKFIGMHDQVYIRCSVMMCEAETPGTRCYQGCLSGGRAKREASKKSSRHFISQGPLRLRRSAESSRSPAINLNLNLVFVAGCLVVAVGMISAAVVVKAKVSQKCLQLYKRKNRFLQTGNQTEDLKQVSRLCRGKQLVFLV